MRWLLVDRIEEFERGKRAVAVKCVSRSEDHVHGACPAEPRMPPSLMIEGMAQTGGILLGDANDFAWLVILAKVPKMTFHRPALPGDTLRYVAEVVNLGETGGTVSVTATLAGGRDAGALVAEGEILFAHLDPDDPNYRGADQRNFVFTNNLLQVMD